MNSKLPHRVRKIFVSYRHDDSAGWTGHLVADLKSKFGEANVFQDIHSIQYGENFLTVIEETLGRTDCTLVVIGPKWLSLTDASGSRRLDNPRDYVRLEVATALKQNSPVIPVLVGGAQMPSDTVLPDDIKAFAQRNAAELTDNRWSADVRQLIKTIARTSPIWKVLLTAIGVVQVAFIATWIYEDNLKTRMNGDELKSATIRSSYLDKMRVGSDECMAGIWPKGAVKGKSYHENGNMVTDACGGVSFELNFFQRFFNDDQLWRSSPSPETAASFAKTYEDVFVQELPKELSTVFTSPLSPVALTLADEARNDIAVHAREVVGLKHDAGHTASLLKIVHDVNNLGLYWTAITALGVIAWFARRAGKIRF